MGQIAPKPTPQPAAAPVSSPPAQGSGMPQQQPFRPRRPQFSMQGFYDSQNPAARAMGWAGAVNFNRGRQQQQSGYDMAATQFQNDMHRNAQSQRDRSTQFGLGALTGLMK
jgi:hypothetical protein